MTTELIKGKLYQVNAGQVGWVIAEYIALAPAHIAHGLNHKGQSEWREPAKHYWKSPLSASGPDYVVLDKGLQVRPVSSDTLTEIDRLKTEIREHELKVQALRKELRALCQ